MMSSAIPARLQFQCGHAALVTLPRIKGESSAQRNERIAREKSAALSRQCDFCGPTVAVTAATRPEEVIGSHMTTADVVAAEPVAAAEPIVAEPAVTEPAVVEPVIAEPAVVEVVVAEAIVAETIVEPVLVEAFVVEPVAKPKSVVEPVSHTNGHIARRSTPRKRQQRFVIEFQVERVLRAADIHDALRQAAALGASEVLAITRED